MKIEINAGDKFSGKGAKEYICSLLPLKTKYNQQLHTFLVNSGEEGGSLAKCTNFNKVVFRNDEPKNYFTNTYIELDGGTPFEDDIVFETPMDEAVFKVSTINGEIVYTFMGVFEFHRYIKSENKFVGSKVSDSMFVLPGVHVKL